MASLSEMLQYAETLDQKKKGLVNAIGDFGSSVGQGMYQRQKLQEQRQKDALDRSFKYVDIQDKLLSIQNKVREQEFETNKLKALGLIPLTPEEQNIVRGASFAGLNGQTQAQPPTILGKMMKLFQNPDKVTYGRGSPTIEVKSESAKKAERTLTPGQSDNRQLHVRSMAKEMAKNEIIQRSKAAGTFDMDSLNPAGFNPSEDQIAKYYNAASIFIEGDKKKSEKLRISALDPNIARLQEITDQINSMADATDPNQIKKREFLKKMRTGLANGGVTAEDPLGLGGTQ